MKKYYLLFLFSTLLTNSIFAATKYWVGTTGAYSNGANWNTMSNGSGTPGAPLNTDDIVIDRNATITIDGTYLPSSLLITNNAVVNFANTSTAKTYTIGGGVISPAFNIANGSTLNITGTGSITLAMLSGSTGAIFGTLDFSGSSSKLDCSFGGGISSIKSGGTIRYGGSSSGTIGTITTFFMESGSTYEIYKDGGSFPTGTYDPNSLILNTGATANLAVMSMNSSTGSYGNYEFNSSLYSGSSTGINQNVSFNNISIVDDGSGKWIFSTSLSSIYTLTINNNLIIGNGSTIVINNAASGSQATTLLIKGNINNNGLITETIGNTGSVIEIGGNTSTTISTVANGITNDISILINKTAGTLTALTDLILPNSPNAKFTLTSGNIDMLTNTKLLFIQNPASNALITGTAASHIIGKLKRSSNQAAGYIFPVSNNAAQFAKTIITTNNNNATDWTVEFVPNNPNATAGLTPGVIDIVTNYYWDISRTGATPADAGFLTFYYGGLTSSSVLLPAQVKVVHWNGTTWQNLGGTDGGGSVDNALGSTGGAAPGDPITTFSPFALGGASGVIPISIEYFNGIKTGNTHKLFFKVNCFSNPRLTLTLERSSNSRNFTSIYSVVADAVRCQQPFDNIDYNPLPGTNYYRLKMTDADGNSTYSNIIGLINNKTGFEVLGISPNPVQNNGNLILNISSAQKTNMQIIITDINGKQVQAISETLSAGSNRLILNVNNFPAGTYQLTCTTAEGIKETTRFIKN